MHHHVHSNQGQWITIQIAARKISQWDCHRRQLSAVFVGQSRKYDGRFGAVGAIEGSDDRGCIRNEN